MLLGESVSRQTHLLLCTCRNYILKSHEPVTVFVKQFFIAQHKIPYAKMANTLTYHLSNLFTLFRDQGYSQQRCMLLLLLVQQANGILMIKGTLLFQDGSAYKFPKLFLAKAPPLSPEYKKSDPECFIETCVV
jgi:hypothetical protein